MEIGWCCHLGATGCGRQASLFLFHPVCGYNENRPRSSFSNCSWFWNNGNLLSSPARKKQMTTSQEVVGGWVGKRTSCAFLSILPWISPLFCKGQDPWSDCVHWRQTLDSHAAATLAVEIRMYNILWRNHFHYNFKAFDWWWLPKKTEKHLLSLQQFIFWAWWREAQSRKQPLGNTTGFLYRALKKGGRAYMMANLKELASETGENNRSLILNVLQTFDETLKWHSESRAIIKYE